MPFWLLQNIDDIKHCRRTKVPIFDLETGARSGLKELEVSEDCGVVCHEIALPLCFIVWSDSVVCFLFFSNEDTLLIEREVKMLRRCYSSTGRHWKIHDGMVALQPVHSVTDISCLLRELLVFLLGNFWRSLCFASRYQKASRLMDCCCKYDEAIILYQSHSLSRPLTFLVELPARK